MEHVFECEDAMFKIYYSVDPDGTPVFADVRLLGREYTPTGPNLAVLFSRLMLVTPTEQPGAVVAGYLLSTIAEELPV